jgi:hypothetical protein
MLLIAEGDKTGNLFEILKQLNHGCHRQHTRLGAT